MALVACGDVAVDARLARLVEPSGAERRIYPSMANLLAVLMRTPGDYVPRDRCIAAVWPDPEDEPKAPEDALRQVAWRVRKALRDTGSAVEVRTNRRGEMMIEGKRRHVRFLTAEQARRVDAMLAAEAA